jgi:hypothetical protein
MICKGKEIWAGIRRESSKSELLSQSRLGGGLTRSVANGFRVEVCGIPGPRMRGTHSATLRGRLGGTLSLEWRSHRDWGHPPTLRLLILRRPFHMINHQRLHTLLG